VAVAFAGLYASLHLIPDDNHANIPPLSFLQAGRPSCHPTNSIKALMYVHVYTTKITYAPHVCWSYGRSKYSDGQNHHNETVDRGQLLSHQHGRYIFMYNISPDVHSIGKIYPGRWKGLIYDRTLAEFTASACFLSINSLCS